MKSKPKKVVKKSAKKSSSKVKAPEAKIEAPEAKIEPSEMKAEILSNRGVEGARRRGLAKAGFAADRCALLGIALEIGPRSNHWNRPKKIGDVVVSELGFAIMTSGISKEALELAVKNFSKVENP